MITPDSPEELEHAIQRLGDDAEEARRLARRAGEIYREQYTIDRMLAGYQQLYLDLLTSRKLGMPCHLENAGLAPNAKEIHTGKEMNNEENDHAKPIPALLPSLDR